jgi:hypothetical protein
MCIRAIDMCNVCSRVDFVGPAGACLACKYDDEPECSATCERCGEAIGAGEPVHAYALSDGTATEVCDDCDTNHGATYARFTRVDDEGVGTVVRRLRTRTRIHACGCAPCRQKRVAAAMRAVLRVAS